MKDVIRRWILTGLSCPAAARVLCRLLGDGVFCVMLHRIGEKDPTRLPPNEDMKVSPAFLERFIVDAKDIFPDPLSNFAFKPRQFFGRRRQIGRASCRERV